MREVRRAGERFTIRNQRTRCSSSAQRDDPPVDLVLQGGGRGGGGGRGRGGEQPLEGAVAEQRVRGEKEGGRGGKVRHLKGFLVRQILELKLKKGHSQSDITMVFISADRRKQLKSSRPLQTIIKW